MLRIDDSRSSDAELYARCMLVPEEEFERHAREPDTELARRFRVPGEQVAAKRRDIGKACRP
jgi:hypothetical protein